MPFLKYTEKISHSRQVESTTAKNGWRQTIYGLNGSKYIGNWKDNEKQGNVLVHILQLICSTAVIYTNFSYLTIHSLSLFAVFAFN